MYFQSRSECVCVLCGVYVEEVSRSTSLSFAKVASIFSDVSAIDGDYTTLTSPGVLTSTLRPIYKQNLPFEYLSLKVTEL